MTSSKAAALASMTAALSELDGHSETFAKHIEEVSSMNVKLAETTNILGKV